MTRQKHLNWAKERALAYVDRGDVNNAFSSIASDLSSHPETKNHPAIELGLMLLAFGNLTTPEDMRRFIEGFN